MSLGLGLFRGDTVGRVVPPLAAGMSRNDEVVQLFLQDAGRVHVHQGEAVTGGRACPPTGQPDARDRRGWLFGILVGDSTATNWGSRWAPD